MKKITSTLLLTIAILTMQGCEERRSVEGSYIILKDKKPYKQGSKYLVATLGKKNFSINAGGSGTYEVSENKVIIQGQISQVFTIQGDDLVNDTWYLKKSSDSEIRALEIKAKEEDTDNGPIIGNEKDIGY